MRFRHDLFAALAGTWNEPRLRAVRARAGLGDEFPALRSDPASEDYLRRLRHGGPVGTEAAFVALAPALDRTATALSDHWPTAGSADLAADVATEAWAQLLIAAPSRVWPDVVVGAHFRVRDRLRTDTRRADRHVPLGPEVIDRLAGGPDPADVAADGDRWRRLAARTGPAELGLVVATRLGGWTPAEWAAERRVPSAVAYRRRARAETRLLRAVG